MFKNLFARRIVSIVLAVVMLAGTVPGALFVGSQIVASKNNGDKGEETIYDDFSDENSESVDDPLLSMSELEQYTIDAINAPLIPIAEPSGNIPVQDPVSKDNTTIENITVRWLSYSTGAEKAAGFGRLDLRPADDTVPNQQFQIDFALSGQNMYEPGDLELVFPAYIWLDRNGYEYGELTLSLPEDPDDKAEFVYRRIGDKIVVTNAKTMSAASKVLIQGTFRKLKAHDVVDNVVSAGFKATVTVRTPYGNSLSMTSNAIDATIDTFAEIAYAEKTAYNQVKSQYDVWWESVPTELPTELRPSDPDNYAYVRWYVSGTAIGNQPYTMTVTDKANGEYGEIMLGVSGSLHGNVKSSDSVNVTATLYDGYATTVKTAYVWTAYPKDQFPKDTAVTLHNTAIVKVVGKDDRVETADSPEATVLTKSPTIYTFVKYWDDNHDRRELRPKSMFLWIWDYNYSNVTPRWKISLTAANRGEDDDHWVYQWSDAGQVCDFDVEERLIDSSGVFDTRYDGEGHRLEYNYVLSKKDYNIDSHTWMYTNSYTEGWYKFNLSNIYKRVEYKYQDSVLKSTRDLALTEIRRGKEVMVKYHVSGSASVALPSVWYGATPCTFTLEDREYRLNGQSLSVEDIDIGAVDLTMPVSWKYTDPDKETGYYGREKIATPEATLFGLVGENWIPMATIKDGVVKAVDGKDAVVSGSRVDLPVGVSRVKLELESDATIVDMAFDVYLRLHPTKTILDMLEDAFKADDYIRFPLENKACIYAVYSGDKVVGSGENVYAPDDELTFLSTSDIGYLHGRNFKVAADLTKHFEVTGNDVNRRLVELRSVLTLSQQSNVLTLSEWSDAVRTGEIPNAKTGTYYDLLPYGVMPDIESVEALNGDVVSDVYVIDNYKGSGRSLLVVDVDMAENKFSVKDTAAYGYGVYKTYPTEGYRSEHVIEFDSYVSWDIVMDKGFSLMYNVAAYEDKSGVVGTMNEWSGEPDDPKAGNHILSLVNLGKDASYMTGLNSKSSGNGFVYAGVNVIYDEIDVYALTDLQKHVQASGSPEWSRGYEYNDVNVPEGGLYTYRLYMKSDPRTTTKDIILLDSIENYIPVSPDKDAGDTTWRGSLVSVDVSQLESLGCDPVIYYSTVKGLDLSRDAYNPSQASGVVAGKLADTTVWSTNKPEDMSTVTAIAVDARKKADGSDFELEPEQAMFVYLYMRAPYDDAAKPDYFKNTDGLDHLKNSHAYNSVQLDCLQTVLGQDTHAYISYSYTKVGIYANYIDVIKKWDDNDDQDGKRPASVTVELYRDGQATGQTVVLNEVNDWHARFDRVLMYDETGDYIRYTYKEHDYTDSDTYALKTETKSVNGNIEVALTNIHVPEKIDIPVMKLWDDNDDEMHARPSSITVRLYADGEFTGKSITIRPDSDGNWSGVFTDLDRYRDHGKEIQYTIQEEDVKDYIPSYDGTIITNLYYPYGDLIVTKKTENVTTAAAGKEFLFTLLLFGEDGSPVVDRYEYTIYNANESKSSSGKIGNGGEFKLKGDQKIVIKDLPSGVSYEVIEGETLGFALVGIEGNQSGTVCSSAPMEVMFTNRYSSRGSAQLSVNKVLTGRTLGRYQFKFDVLDLDDNLVKTAYNDGDGVVNFGRIYYTEADDGTEFIYKIVEEKVDKPGYTYDETVYKVKVVPEDNGDGTMSCTIQYLDNNKVVDSLTFNNVYHADGDFIVRLWKTLDGRDLKADEFSFGLYDATGKRLLTAKNSTDGTVVFPGIHFTEVSSGLMYAYYVEEIRGSDQTVVYDENVIVYIMTVVDNGDGTLSFEQRSYVTGKDNTRVFNGNALRSSDMEALITVLDEEAQPVLNNGLQPGSLAISKYTDNGDREETFKFKVKLIGDKVEDGPMDYTLSYADPDTSGFVLHEDEVITAPPVFDVEMVGEDKDVSVSDGVNVIAENSGDLGTEVFAGVDFGNDLPAGVADREIIDQGQRGDVIWELFDDYEVVIKPANGVEGTLSSLNSVLGIYSSRITKFSVIGLIHAPDSMASYFEGWSRLESVDFSGLDVSSTRDMGYMFSGCLSLKFINFGDKFDTSQVTSMNNMFSLCKSLQTLDLGDKFDTSQVKNMGNMFYYCSSLENLNLGDKFDTSQVTDMGAMFYYCLSLQNLDLGDNFDTSRVTSMNSMFYGCSSLQTLDLGDKFDTSQVEDMASMFRRCSSLQTLDLGDKFDTSQVKKMSSMFYNCSSLQTLDLGDKFDTSRVTIMIDGSSPSSSYGMFGECSSLQSLDLGDNFDTSQVINLNSMFYNCKSLQTLDLGDKFDTSRVTSMSSMFYNCSSLQILDLGDKFDTSQVKDMQYMFYYCNAFQTFDFVDNFDTSAVTNMRYMFAYCTFLQSLNFGDNFDTSAVTDMRYMFAYCMSLQTLDLGDKFDTSQVLDMYNMFCGCTSLQTLDLGDKFDTSQVTDMGSMFKGCSSLHSLDLGDNFDTSMVLRMSYMFYGCSSLQTLDLGDKFDTSRVTNVDYMFTSCDVLSEIMIPDCFFNASKFIVIPTPSSDITTGKWVRKSMVDDPNAPAYEPYEWWSKGGTEVTGDTWVWQPKPKNYSIDFTSTPDSIGYMSRIEDAIAEEDYVLPKNLFYRLGYDFIGWRDEAKKKNFDPVGGVITILKNTYEAGTNVTLAARWSAIDTSVVVKDGEFEFTLHGGEKATFDGIPAGTAYQVWEETPGGWVLVKEVGTSGEIAPMETKDAKFYNVYTPGSITASIVANKVLDGKPADVDSNGTAFEFQLLEGNTVKQTKSAGAGGSVRFDSITYTSEGTYTYTIREVDKGNTDLIYDQDTETVQVKVTKNSSGVLQSEVIYVNGTPVFENRTKPGTLQLNKVISGDSIGSKEFSFKVTLYHGNGTFYSETIYKVKAGEVVTISDIPAGMRYEVEEIDIPSGWSKVSETGISGTISPNTVSTVSIGNAYSANGMVLIEAHKRFEGNTLESGMFEFELLDKDEHVLQTAYNGIVDDREFVDDAPNLYYGTGKITFDAIFYDKPGDYEYYIREKQSDKDGVIYDSHTEHIVVHVTDTKGVGVLDAEVEYLDGGSGMFTNSMQPGALMVSKDLLNETENAAETEFSFVISLTDSAGNPITGSFSVTKSDGSSLMIQDGDTVTIKGGENFTILDLPHGAIYKIVELDSDGFELLHSDGSSGVIMGGKTSYASFTNVYSSKGSIILQAKKEFIGGVIEGDMFQFELRSESGEVLQTVYADDTGDIRFVPIDFTEADAGKQYRYFIVEVKGDDDHITYDNHQEVVIVDVEDIGNGEVVATATYDEDGAVFTNIAAFDVKVHKIVAGNMGNKTEDFSFNIQFENDDYELPLTIGYKKGNDSGQILLSEVYEFTLSHDEMIEFIGVPMDTFYVIEEAENNYSVRTEVVTPGGTERSIGRASYGKVESGMEITYINTISSLIPTGMNPQFFEIAFMLFGFGTLFFFIKKCRSIKGR